MNVLTRLKRPLTDGLIRLFQAGAFVAAAGAFWWLLLEKGGVAAFGAVWVVLAVIALVLWLGMVFPRSSR